MRSVLALVVAAAMVVAALYARGDLDNSTGPLARPEPARLVCVEELAAVCESFTDDGVDVTVEDAGVTAERLSSEESREHDAWLTLGPWHGIVADARLRSGMAQLSDRPATVLASSPLVLVVRAERAAVLKDRCGGELTWRCIARFSAQDWDDVGGSPQWGPLKPGYADAELNATGLLVLGSAAASIVGRTDFSARDLDGDTFLRRLTDLESAVPNHGSAGDTPLQQQVRLPATFDFVGTTEAEAGPLLERSANRASDLQLLYPETPAVAEVVLAPLEDSSGADRLQELVGKSGAALARAGWRVAGEPAAPGVPTQPPLPDESNLPAAGVLDALRARWGEIR